MGTEHAGDRPEVEAARSVLIELCGLLGAYRDDIVVIGGWVPELLLAGGPERHVGSTDVDLALNHRTLHEASYKTIQELLLARGYRQGGQPFIYQRTVAVAGREVADFEALTDPEARALRQRDAYERVSDLLERLGMNRKDSP